MYHSLGALSQPSQKPEYIDSHRSVLQIQTIGVALQAILLLKIHSVPLFAIERLPWLLFLILSI